MSSANSKPLRGLIGVVHVPAMPGDPIGALSFDEAIELALGDVDALNEGGASGIIIENFGSAPFVKGSMGAGIDPHQIACLTIIAREAKQQSPIPIGVNCLRNDARAAVGIAAATGCDFVRVNVHIGAYLTDQGIIEGEAAHTLRYRAALSAQRVRIFADVLVKHAAPLAPTTVSQSVQDCLNRGHADAVIVTGNATGAPVDESVLQEARTAAGNAPIVIGSGLTPTTVQLMRHADAAIVGTYLKKNGDISQPVDARRVAEMATAIEAHLSA